MQSPTATTGSIKRHIMKRYFGSIAAVVLLLLLGSCTVGRFIIYNYADVKDHKKFPSRPIDKGESTFKFPVAEPGKAPDKISIEEEEQSFENYLKDNETLAFLIIQNDSIQYENYFDDYDKSSIVPSFSMAKSVTSILIGCAIDDKLIDSVNEPVTNYVPELKEKGFDKVTIENVLQMTSGLDFDEGYRNPFGDVAEFYYGRNLRKATKKLELETGPGQEFDYESGNAQLLGLILERSLQDKNISDYLEEKLWKPLGMEFDTSWSLDKKKNGLEKTFCCINARARDYAKIGWLYLNKGNWKGEQIVSEDWVDRSTKVDTSKGSAWYYQYQWWLPTKNGDFMAEGLLGQYIYVNPSKNLIMVRLGKDEGDADWSEILTSLAEAY